MTSWLAVAIGFGIDLIVGDPHEIPHPVVWIGRLISTAERLLRKWLPKSERGEKLAGAILWLVVASFSWLIPFLLVRLCGCVGLWLRIAVESIMCWQILAIKSLRVETMKVYAALKDQSLESARSAVSMVVGRDTRRLDRAGVIRAAVETIAENTSDGIVAPLLFLILGGAPLGFFYKAVNTMDSMLGYTDPPYTNIGLVPAKMDDVMNYIPARLCALFMLAAGVCMGLPGQNGWKIFRRDRYNHASPNSAQTESMCAGLMGIRLAGDAWYHGVLHQKPYIGDPIREVQAEDIPLACRLMLVTSILAMLILSGLKLMILL